MATKLVWKFKVELGFYVEDISRTSEVWHLILNYQRLGNTQTNRNRWRLDRTSQYLHYDLFEISRLRPRPKPDQMKTAVPTIGLCK